MGGSPWEDLQLRRPRQKTTTILASVAGPAPQLQVSWASPGARSQKQRPMLGRSKTAGAAEQGDRAQAPHSRLERHANRRPQAAQRTCCERDVAAMAAGDVAGDGEPQTRVARVLIARVIEPVERT